MFNTDESVVLVDPHDLKPHPLNARVYGDVAPPPDLFESIERGWSRTSVLEALPDGTLIKGHLRRFVAIQLHLAQVPVHYRADLTDDESAQVEELLRDNAGRVKTREVVGREWRLAFETFKAETGSVSGEKSRDVVGKRFGVSGVTLEHGIGVVNALDSKHLDSDLRTKVREVLEQRGVEPAWKLLRKGLPESTESPLDGDSEQSGAEEVSLAVSPQRRQKALLDVLAAIAQRELALDEPEAVALALPRESLEDTLVKVEVALRVLGLIEGEIRDRMEAGRRTSKKGRRQ